MEREHERDLDEIVDTLHDSPVGTKDPNIVSNEEPQVVTEEDDAAAS